MPIGRKSDKPISLGRGAPPWMVSYSDLVTQLLVFFVMLFALSAAATEDQLKKLQEKMAQAETYTQDFNKRTIDLALAYDGQAEIVDAAKKIAEDYQHNQLSLDSLTTSKFNEYLYSLTPPPDLIIRTSGTKRLSGFLTYQSAYSELYFIDKYWPEFTEQDFNRAIAEYESRERRFGK